jgi:hypothetical protein
MFIVNYEVLEFEKPLVILMYHNHYSSRRHQTGQTGVPAV